MRATVGKIGGKPALVCGFGDVGVYDCSHSLPCGIMRATDVMIGDKRALDCGYCDAGKPAHSPCTASAPAY